ncbi:MAG TPA: dual specificity protein phosphatase family protein [Candidatus Paceibacterota bacterium]
MLPHGPKDLFNHITGRKGFDYTQITDEIFIGTNMCCQYGFSKELLSKGVRADISLEENRIDTPKGVDYFLWLPTKDHEAPSKQNIEIGVKALDTLIKNKTKTFIHCKNGHGRAPTLFAAYLISKGMTVKEAINFMTAKRTSIHINESQMKALENFRTELKKPQ